VTDGVSAGPAPARDFDGLYKSLLARHPRDALEVLCGVRLGGQEVVLDGPTELPRQRSLQRDKVFLVRHDDRRPADVYHVEVQVKRTEDFQERMVAYWAGLALKYRRTDHRIHQVVIWPQGGGYPGSFRRDEARLDYRAVNVPEDLDPEALLAVRWPRSRSGPPKHHPTSSIASPTGSRRPSTSRRSSSRSSWVFSWEARSRTRSS
jgi:hypothetical protein